MSDRPASVTLTDVVVSWLDSPRAGLGAIARNEHGVVELSREMLRRLVVDYAAALQASGVARGDRVVLATDRSADFYSGFWACQAVGAVAVPTPAIFRSSSSVEETRLINLINATSATVAIVDDRTAETLTVLAASATIPRVRRIRSQPAARDDIDHPVLMAHHPAVIQFSSGSMADPKGCVLSHGAIVANTRSIQTRMGLDRESRGVSWVPLYHDMGLISAVCLPLCADDLLVPVLMSPREFLLRPTSWLRQLSDNRASTTSAPNFAIDVVNRHLRRGIPPGLDLSHLRTLVIGAEPIVATVIEEFLEHLEPYGLSPDSIHPAYGLAECVLLVTSSSDGLRSQRFSRDALQLRGRAVPARSASADDRRLVSLGQPADGTEVRVVDENDETLSHDHIGSIQVRSEAMMTEYLDDATATEQVWCDGWLRTGDLGFVDEAGALYIVGREKDVIIVNGVNHDANDIEQAVERHPATRPGGVAAFGTELGRSGEELVIAVEAKAGDAPGLAQAIRELCEAEVGVVPSEIVVVRRSSLPRTSSGKIRRHAARAQYESGALRVVHTEAEDLS